jgi:hypothetical protein
MENLEIRAGAKSLTYRPGAVLLSFTAQRE